MPTRTFTEINKLFTILIPFFEDDTFETVNVTKKEGKLLSMDLDLLDDNNNLYNFIDKINDLNNLRKKDKKIDLNYNLDKSSFGIKVLSNGKVCILKLQRISYIKLDKTVFDKDGRVMISVIDTKLLNGSLKRSWKSNYVIMTMRVI